MDKEKILGVIVLGAIWYFADFHGVKTTIQSAYKTFTAPVYKTYPDEFDYGIGGEKYLKSKKECPIYHAKEPLIKSTFICADYDKDDMISSQDRCIRCNQIYHAHK